MGKRNRKLIYFIPSIFLYAFLLVGGLYFIIIESLGYIPTLNMEHISLTYFVVEFKSPHFINDLLFTLYVSFFATTLSIFVGILFSYALFHSKNTFINALTANLLQLGMITPYLYMIFIVVLTYSKTGILSRILYTLGLIQGFSSFPTLVFERYGIGIILVYTLKGIPFITLFLLNVLNSMSRDYKDIATTLGSGPMQTFERIYLPLCANTLTWAGMILFAYDFGSFEVPYILGSLNPQSLSVRLYSHYVNPNLDSIPQMMAVALILFIIGLIAVIAYGKLISLIIRIKLYIIPAQFKSYNVFWVSPLLTIVIIAIIIPCCYVLLLSVNNFFKYPVLMPNIFTLDHWRNTLQYNKLFLASIGNSFRIGSTVAIFSTVIGFITGRGIVKHFAVATQKSLMLISLPLFIPGISLFIGAHQVLIHTPFINHWIGVVIAHTLLCIPYTTNIAIAYFKGISQELELVATNLGAHRIKRFQLLILPLIKPGIALALSVSFLISNTDYFATFLIGGGNTITLAMVMYPYITNNDYGLSAVTGITFILIHLITFIVLHKLLIPSQQKNILYGVD